MTLKEKMHHIDTASDRVKKEISDMHKSAGGSKYACLAGEGYAGGYLQALYDVKVLFGGGLPNTRDYWEVR